MKSKTIYTALSAALSVAIVALMLGLIAAPAYSQVSVPVGKTTQQSSQLVFWYDAEDIDQNRRTVIQVTNAGANPVNVHVQIFASTCTDFDDTVEDACAPGALVLCQETDFNDFYTQNDTHRYFMFDEICRNDPLNDTCVGDVGGTKGFVVVTPIDGPGTRNAIAHQHMMGTSYVFDRDTEASYGVSSMGRDAVSFSSGAVVADGTVLDGVANGYVLIQPEILKFVYTGTQDIDFGDVVSISFRDNYEGVFGYVAEPADAVWTPLIFDSSENPISCTAVPQNCFFNIGLNDEHGPTNDLLNPSEKVTLCPTNDNSAGWTKVAVGGLDGLENELGLFYQTGEWFDDANYGWAYWMHAE